jgi:hypothetical protein
MDVLATVFLYVRACGYREEMMDCTHACTHREGDVQVHMRCCFVMHVLVLSVCFDMFVLAVTQNHRRR